MLYIRDKLRLASILLLCQRWMARCSGVLRLLGVV